MLSLMVLAEGTVYQLPGWVGGFMALLSLILPVALYFWMKNQR